MGFFSLIKLWNVFLASPVCPPPTVVPGAASPLLHVPSTQGASTWLHVPAAVTWLGGSLVPVHSSDAGRLPAPPLPAPRAARSLSASSPPCLSPLQAPTPRLQREPPWS